MDPGGLAPGELVGAGHALGEQFFGQGEFFGIVKLVVPKRVFHRLVENTNIGQ